VALHAIAGWGAAPGLAQVSNVTTTQSTTSSSSVESPPSCAEIGTSRVVETITLTTHAGPMCIGIGNRDVANPTPVCGDVTQAPPPSDPGFGTTHIVPFGSTTTNFNTHTETIQCVAPVPALPLPLLVGLGGALTGLGLWRV